MNREYAIGVSIDLLVWWMLVNRDYALGVSTDLLEGEYSHVDVRIGGYFSIESNAIGVRFDVLEGEYQGSVQSRRCWDWWILVNREYAI